MKPQSFEVLLNWILTELEENQSIFGIQRSLFCTPKKDGPYANPDVFGQYMATPIGPGAGPHTQLAQNIVSAWLCGARFIELKTVQIMDELTIPRPCIDMEDEGYNVEFSQELKLDQSAWEYIKAWALIHILHRVLGFEGKVPLGTVFNMSVGYDLKGIQSPPMVHFMDRLQDASKEIAEIRKVLKEKFPKFADIEIPAKIVNSVTLSTMHGCPPGEIEKISRHLMEDRGLHTTVKLNPTLLGKDEVIHILHDRLGFKEIKIPDAVFEHDLKYDLAIKLIRALQKVAKERGLVFGVKLSNTLASVNHKGNLPGEEMYMSGRALYPITINLFHKLSKEFGGDLEVSFSAGADALNITSLLASGVWSVSTVSDLLKPGGYANLVQYLENLERDMRSKGAKSLKELAKNKMANLELEAARALDDPRYKKSYHPFALPKVESKLELFDCVNAPCMEQCSVLQDVSEYARMISQREYDKALEIILARNPLPLVTGYVCTHLCQTRCTRNNYDAPVAIRVLKRFAAEKGKARIKVAEKSGHKVAVIGSGPSGLAAAYFLAVNGIEAVVYEAKDRPGGMLAIAPAFRLPKEVVRDDIERIKSLGVKIELSHPITGPPEELLNHEFDAVYVASGFPEDARLGIEGEDGKGVYRSLDFLERVSRGEKFDLGKKVLVIGGGNTAMDAARTAKRLTGGQVLVVYRRTREEMPAEKEEVEELLEEKINIEELAAPKRIVLRNGRAAALECVRNKLGAPGPDGRRRPVPVEGGEFQIEADSIITGIGQRPDVSLFDKSSISLNKDGTLVADPQTGLTGHERVYAGGDVVRGPETIIAACADGRRAAEAICRQLGVKAYLPERKLPTLSKEDIVKVKRVRARKEAQHVPPMLPPEKRGGFDLVEAVLTEKEAQEEADRCMQCSSFCDKCVEVCPNRANYTFFVSPMSMRLPKVSSQQGGLKESGDEIFRVLQGRQILHVQDFCNQCGDCATFCVYNGKPYMDKPKLFFERGDFDREDGNAFHIERMGKEWVIRRRGKGKESSLFAGNGTKEMTFENEWLRMKISPDFKINSMELKKDFKGEFSLVGPAEMYVILKGVTTSLPFLPFARSQ
ncbi:MAG: putative selenate reductase subunit YgfK [Candidatus Hadarchaeota archaeon]